VARAGRGRKQRAHHPINDACSRAPRLSTVVFGEPWGLSTANEIPSSLPRTQTWASFRRYIYPVRRFESVRLPSPAASTRTTFRPIRRILRRARAPPGGHTAAAASLFLPLPPPTSPSKMKAPKEGAPHAPHRDRSDPNPSSHPPQRFFAVRLTSACSQRWERVLGCAVASTSITLVRAALALTALQADG